LLVVKEIWNIIHEGVSIPGNSFCLILLLIFFHSNQTIYLGGFFMREFSVNKPLDGKKIFRKVRQLLCQAFTLK
jgi:hypothetical protein